MLFPDHCELQWAAGLLEGEGSFPVTYRETGAPMITIQCKMTDLDVLEHLQSIFDVGNIYQHVKPTQSHHRQQWVWMVQAKNDVYALAAMLYPLMGERRQKQILQLIEGFKNMTGVAQGQRGDVLSHKL